VEFFYIFKNSIEIDSKQEIVKILKMPDLAISTEAHYIRNRSITDLFEVFGLGPSLLPYFPSEYIYTPPPYLNAGDYIEPKAP